MVLNIGIFNSNEGLISQLGLLLQVEIKHLSVLQIKNRFNKTFEELSDKYFMP
jgi:hypothetical protein